MLSEADLKLLNYLASSGMRRAFPLALILVGVISCGAGIANEILASKFAALAHMPLSDVYSLWSSGFQNRDYPGAAIMAVDRLSTGVIKILFGILFFLLAFISWKRAQWYQRIRDELHGKDA